MMAYEQLERYFRLLEVISGYEKILIDEFEEDNDHE